MTAISFDPEEIDILRSLLEAQLRQARMEQNMTMSILAIQNLADEIRRLVAQFEGFSKSSKLEPVGAKEPTTQSSTQEAQSMSWVFNMFHTVLQKLDAILAEFDSINKKLDTVITNQQAERQELGAIEAQQQLDSAGIALILKYLTPPLPVALIITFTGGSAEMAKPKSGKLKFNVLDNGHATATLTPVDAVGIATTLPAGSGVPTWASSDPGVVLTPAADGMTCDVAPASPPVLVTGAVITATCVLADGTSITGSNSADPINIVAGPAGSFVVSVA